MSAGEERGNFVLREREREKLKGGGWFEEGGAGKY